MDHTVSEEVIETPVAQFHYARAGNGPPVLLLPGSGGWKLNFADLIGALAPEHTVYALDPPGQGRTRILVRMKSFGTEAIAEAINGFLDAVGIARTAIVGHSWGGGFALRFAELHPNRVTRLALIAPGGLDVPDIWEFRAMRLPIIGEVGVRLLSEASVRHLMRKAFHHRDRVADHRIREYVAMMREPGRSDRLADLLRVERSVDWATTEDDLHLVDVPVLLLWGGRDQYFPAHLADRFTARLPQVHVQIIDDGGHSLHDDCPATVTPLLRDFLAQAIQ